MKQRVARLCIRGLSILCLLIFVAGCDQKPEKTVVRVDNVNAYVEFAATASARQQGLMHRERLAKDEGMLLAFARPQVISLWMLNTPLPLDVGFFDEDGRLFQVVSMVPDGGKKIYKSLQPGRYALEMNLGWFSRHGLKVGAMLRGEALNLNP